MNWIEVSLSVDGEAAEVVTELLQRYGHQGVVIEQEGVLPGLWDDGAVPPPERLTVRAYLPDDEAAAGIKARLETALGHLNRLYPMPTPHYRAVVEDDWAEAWKQHYHPIRIGRRLLICPQWAEAETQPNDLIIMLDPGMAFGTGTHPTTQLCLEALEDLVQPALRVIDLGCGSGILSIAAAKLGAAQVVALDSDPLAVEITQGNAAQNGVGAKIQAQPGSLGSLIGSPRRFDLMAVNILARTIIQMCAEGLEQVLRPGGVGIFSGIIDEQADDVEAALTKTGLRPYKRRRQGDWVLIEARRPYDE